MLADGIPNRWILDAMYKGYYPSVILNLLHDHAIDAGIYPGDAAFIGTAKFNFFGINYYAPQYFRWVKNEKNYSAESYEPKVSLWHSLRHSHLWPVHARISARLRPLLTRGDKSRPGCPDCIPGCVFPQTGSVVHS